MSWLGAHEIPITPLPCLLINKQVHRRSYSRSPGAHATERGTTRLVSTVKAVETEGPSSTDPKMQSLLMPKAAEAHAQQRAASPLTLRPPGGIGQAQAPSEVTVGSLGHASNIDPGAQVADVGLANGKAAKEQPVAATSQSSGHGKVSKMVPSHDIVRNTTRSEQPM
jgi:hypothetical protein